MRLAYTTCLVMFLNGHRTAGMKIIRVHLAMEPLGNQELVADEYEEGGRGMMFL